jgi:hypothetical protein
VNTGVGPHELQMKALRWALGIFSFVALPAMFTIAWVIPLFLSREEFVAFIPYDDLGRLIFGIGGLFVALGFFLSVGTLVPEDKRMKWRAALLFGHLVAIPFYWFLYVRPRPEGA